MNKTVHFTETRSSRSRGRPLVFSVWMQEAGSNVRTFERDFVGLRKYRDARDYEDWLYRLISLERRAAQQTGG
jgi:hypothetical protein